MKKHITILSSLLGGAALLSLSSCEVKKTEDGSLPEVKIEGETSLPEYDVQAPQIETGTTEIEVPTLEITPASELPDAEVDEMEEEIATEPDTEPVPDFDTDFDTDTDTDIDQ